MRNTKHVEVCLKYHPNSSTAWLAREYDRFTRKREHSMNISFDGLRKKIADQYNEVVDCFHDEDGRILRDNIKELGEFLSVLMCVFDNTVEGDINDLSNVEIHDLGE